MDELLTGKRRPISNSELTYWAGFRIIQREIQEAADGESQEPEDSLLPASMGQQY